MNLEQQVEVLYSLKKTDERHANRILHHCQTAMYWLAVHSRYLALSSPPPISHGSGLCN